MSSATITSTWLSDARLAAIAPAGFSRVFFANSGSEANDTVVKLVRYFWKLKGKPKKQTMIGRTYGYHGVTLAAAHSGPLAAMIADGALAADMAPFSARRFDVPAVA